MWHEARKQEKKIRSMMVDHQKRADRRRQFYEKIKMDPTQFLRVYGRQTKIHLEPSVALAAEGPQSMVAWTGDRNTMIDRFDVRAHLDYIPEHSNGSPELNSDEEEEELQCNYERYRILVQNDCAGVTEEQCLHQLYIDEQFGGMEAKLKEKEKEEEKKKKAMSKAAIGFSYDGGGGQPANVEGGDGGKDEAEEEEESDEEVDLDLVFDIDNLNEEQMVSLNKCSVQFGMRGDLYIEHLYKEREEMEMLKQARLDQDEKAQFSGRKSRRERRAFKEKRLKSKGNSPPSYAVQTKTSLLRSSSSRSRSRSPVVGHGRTTYITSFGGNSDDEGAAPKVEVLGPKLPSPEYLAKKTTSSSKPTEKSRSSKSRSRSRQRSNSNRDRRRLSRDRDMSRRRSRSRSRRSRSRSGRFERHGRYPAPRQRSRRSRSRSRGHRSRSRSRDRRRSRTRSRDRRRSRSRSRDRRRSRSRSRDRGSRRSRSRDRRRSSPRPRSPVRGTGNSNSKKTSGRSKSRSPLIVREAGGPRAPSPPPLKRYRRESVSSGNDISDDSDTESKSSSTHPQKDKRSESLMSGAFGSSTSGKSSKISAAEKLKRRLQLQLNKNFKADKKAQKEKVEKLEQERMEREEDIRLAALEMRRRAREKRVDSDDEGTNWAGDSPRRRRRSRSRSASRSDDSDDTPANRSSGDVKPLLSLKLDSRDHGNGRSGDNQSEERKRPPRQYDDDRYRRQSDDVSRDSDYSRRRDDDGRSNSDRSRSRNYDSNDRHRSDVSSGTSRGGLVDY